MPYSTLSVAGLERFDRSRREGGFPRHAIRRGPFSSAIASEE